MAGRSRKNRQKKGAGCWSDKVKEVMKRKKDLYKKALSEKTVGAWEEYKRANKEAKRVVKEAKEEELVRCGTDLQNDFLSNRRKFWKKVKGRRTNRFEN